MAMNKDNFEDFLDPETARELRIQFQELQIKQQQERIENNPEEKWFYEFSTALGELNVQYFREPGSEFMYVRLSKNTEFENKTESILIHEIEEYMVIGVPAAAVASAIRAGLISHVFKFWKDSGDLDESEY